MYRLINVTVEYCKKPQKVIYSNVFFGVMQQISEDGKWKWDGTEWVANDGGNEVPSSEVADIPVAATPSVSQVPVQAMAPMAASASSSGGVWAIQTAEYGLFFTKLIGFLLTGITLGFGLPWAKCMVINKWTKKVRIDGRSIRFTGTPMGLFGIWVKVCVLSILTLTLYYWFAGYKQVAKYVDNNITWA